MGKGDRKDNPHDNGWDRAPLRRIALTSFDAGAQMMLAFAWSRSDWGGNPGEVYGFLWASLATLARASNVSEGAARKRLTKVMSKGYVVPLREMTPGELHLANYGRKQVGVRLIECRCKARERTDARRNECCCRVLRPIGEKGQLIRDPLNAPPDLYGLHVGPRRSRDPDPTGEWVPTGEWDSAGELDPYTTREWSPYPTGDPNQTE